MLTSSRLFWVLMALFASLALATPVPGRERERTPRKDLARSRSPAKSPPPSGMAPASSPPVSQRTLPLGSNIVVGGALLTLGEELGRGQTGVAYAVSDRKRVAKQFTKAKTDLYLLEVRNTEKVLGAGKMIHGDSQANKAGDVFSWIITPRVYGRKFAETDTYIALRQPGQKQACVKWLKEVVRPEFERKLIAFTGRTGLVHLDPVKANTFWDTKGEKIVDFIDYAHMDVVNGPEYKVKSSGLAPGTTLSLADMAEELAFRYYADSDICI